MMQDGDTIVFCGVKTRRGHPVTAPPREAVTTKSSKRFGMLQLYLQQFHQQIFPCGLTS